MEICIGRHFEFEACHQLPEAPQYGKCSNLHGHRYELEVVVKGEVNREGWICDFSEVKGIVNEAIINLFDHADLNVYFEIPTAENILQFIYTKLSEAFLHKPYQLSRLKLYETRKCFVELIL